MLGVGVFLFDPIPPTSVVTGARQDGPLATDAHPTDWERNTAEAKIAHLAAGKSVFVSAKRKRGIPQTKCFPRSDRCCLYQLLSSLIVFQ